MSVIQSNYKSALNSAGVLGAFAVIALGLVTGIHQGTQARIAANERAALSSRLYELAPGGGFDNDIITDVISIKKSGSAGIETPLKIYRARKNGIPVAGIIEVVAPDGYNGSIHLLVGIDMDGTLTGVRVIAHWV